MPDQPITSIAVRLNYFRTKRRLSVRNLAGLAGLSPSFVSMLESGDRKLLRRGDLYALAEALRITPAQLTGHGESAADPVRMAAYGAVPEVRRALLAPREVAARPVAVVTGEVRRMVRCRLDADFTGLAVGLPELVDECTSGMNTAPDSEREQWTALLGRSVQLAHILGKGLAMPDLAALASDQQRRIVVSLGPLHQSVEAAIRSMLWTTLGMRDEAVGAANTAAHLVEPLIGAGGKAAAVAYGLAHLAAATAAATLHRGADVVSHIGEAARVATRLPYGTVALGEPMDPAVVRTWAVWSAVEAGEPDRVRHLTRNVDFSRMHAERRAALGMDTARGLAEARNAPHRAVAALRTAEGAAPQRVRAYSLIREIVAALMRQTRDEDDREYLTGLAVRCGLDIR